MQTLLRSRQQLTQSRSLRLLTQGQLTHWMRRPHLLQRLALMFRRPMRHLLTRRHLLTQQHRLQKLQAAPQLKGRDRQRHKLKTLGRARQMHKLRMLGLQLMQPQIQQCLLMHLKRSQRLLNQRRKMSQLGNSLGRLRGLCTPGSWF